MEIEVKHVLYIVEFIDIAKLSIFLFVFFLL